MRREPAFWVALAVAFVVGLMPGLGLTAWARHAAQGSTAGAQAELTAREKTWDAEKADLSMKLASAEASISALSSQVTSLTSHAKLQAAAPASQEDTVQAGKQAPAITSRAVTGTTSPGKPITLVVKVKGTADKVTMRLVKADPGTSFVKTYALVDTGVSGGVHVWKKTVTCPSEIGEYRYFADAYLGSTHVSMASGSAWSFQVE